MQKIGRGKQSIATCFASSTPVVLVYVSNSEIVSYDFCAGDQARQGSFQLKVATAMSVVSTQH